MNPLNMNFELHNILKDHTVSLTNWMFTVNGFFCRVLKMCFHMIHHLRSSTVRKDSLFRDQSFITNAKNALRFFKVMEIEPELPSSFSVFEVKSE